MSARPSRLPALVLVAMLAACGGPRILRNPATVRTTETRKPGETVCWVEPSWMKPGSTECNGIGDPAPGIPRCPTSKSDDEPRPSRTEWTTMYKYDAEATVRARVHEPLACCYLCEDHLHDLGM